MNTLNFSTVLALLIFARSHTTWLWICLAGFLLGLPGLATMIVHDRHRRERTFARCSKASRSKLQS